MILHRLSLSISKIGLLIGLTAFAATGCSTSSTDATAPKPSFGSGVDLRKYQKVTVVAFDTSVAEGQKALIGERFAKEIAWRLKHGFVGAFDEVRQGQPVAAPEELIVTGSITSFERGLQNIGGWSFAGEVVLKDGVTGQILYKEPFNTMSYGLITWQVTGVEVCEAKAAQAIANTIARAKGWHARSK